MYLWILLVDPSCQRDCKPMTVQLGRILISCPQIDFERICRGNIPKIIIVILCVSLASQTLTLKTTLYIHVKSNFCTCLLISHLYMYMYVCRISLYLFPLFPPYSPSLSYLYVEFCSSCLGSFLTHNLSLVDALCLNINTILCIPY